MKIALKLMELKLEIILLSQKKLMHGIGPRFSLDQIVAAHECVEAGRDIGNVVIDI